MREDSTLMCPKQVERVSVPQMRSGCVQQCQGSTAAPGQFAPRSVARVSVPQMRSGCVQQCQGSTAVPGQFNPMN